MKRIHKLASAMALAAALAACTPEPEALFADAETAFTTNDFNAARVNLIAGLKEQPGNAEMHLLLARTQLALGSGEAAAAALRKLPADMLAEPRVAVIRAEAEVLRGQYDAAMGLVEGIENGAADRVRALAYIGLEDANGAAEAFATGAARDEAHAPLLASYARFELARGDTGRALELVAQALEADSKLVEAYLVKGRILERTNDLPGALEAFDAALALHPGNFDGRLGKAEVLASLGEGDGANELAAQLEREAPDSPEIAYLKARIVAREGDWEGARKILQTVESDLLDNPNAAALYAEALIELNQPGFALSFVQPEFNRQPGWRKLRVLVARGQLATGDEAAALATIRPLASRPDATPQELELAAKAAGATGSASATGFEQRISQPSPEWVGGELAKADTALRNRQWREAESSYQSIISRTRANNAMVLNNLAFAQEKQGKLDQALENALKAVEMEGDNASILDTAGWLLVQTGSKARGLEMLRKAAEIAPDNPTVARHLREAEAM